MPPAAYERLHQQSRHIETAFAARPSQPVPCHNDLLPGNVLFAEDRVWLLDYEYAGMNDVFFDLANLSVKGAGKLFAGAPSTYAEVIAAADRSDAPPRFALPGSALVSISSETKLTESRNVAALLPGADRRLKDEVVVLSAHLDHVGIGAEEQGTQPRVAVRQTT